MTNSSIKILLAAFLAGAIYSCDEDTTSTIGSSLTGSDVTIVIDSAYTVEGKTLKMASIRPKASSFVLGNLAIENYGTLTSDVVTQFLPSTALDTANYSYNNVDSLFLTLRYAIGNYIGDSIAPMGLTVYPLNKALPTSISSDFNPDGYYNTTPLATTTYNTLPESNQLNSTETYREILVKLPQKLGQDIFKNFQDNPANFANGEIFSENVFPGVYMRSSFGSGRMTVISSASLTFYLRKITEVNDSLNDTINSIHQYMLSTPEVISNNNLSYKMSPTLENLFNEGKDLLVAPLGYEMEIKLPGKKLIEDYSKNTIAVLNNLTMTIPCDSISNNASVTPPPYVLLVLKKDRDAFFRNNKLPDNKTSFYATYSAGTGYSFGDMRSYLLDLLDKAQDSKEITEEDYTFCLVPVQVTQEAIVSSYSYTTQYTVTDVQPYLISPVMGCVDLDKVKIKLTYTVQKAH